MHRAAVFLLNILASHSCAVGSGIGLLPKRRLKRIDGGWVTNIGEGKVIILSNRSPCGRPGITMAKSIIVSGFKEVIVNFQLFF